MESYYIQRTDSAPQWDVIPTLSLHNILWLPDANIRMTQQICYDDLAIYIHQRATEAHIRAMHHSPLVQVCEDSCMEFFFCPMPGDGRYFNFEWNLNGCLYLGFGTGRHHSVRLQPTEPTTLFDFHSNRTADGWEIFYKIPLSFIQLFFPDFRLQTGAAIRANCYKCGKLTAHPHYLTWNPSTSPTPDFHRPRDFGEMIMA